MKFIRCLLLLSAYVALSQSDALGGQQGLPSEATKLVTNLYRQVIARHPVGIPDGEDLKVFAPYLSKHLLRQIDQYRACTGEWDRKNAASGQKSPVGLFENDIFSGAYEEAYPQSFKVERTERDGQGQLRVYVRLTSVSPPAAPEVWKIAILMSREQGRFLLDDVIYLKDENRPTDQRLSGYFSKYCQGPRFIGPH